jgi:hypothetical protein
MADDDAPKRIGRPTGATGRAKKLRPLRMGPLWEQGQAVAEAHGITMTALVEEALRREIARLGQRDARQDRG